MRRLKVLAVILIAAMAVFTNAGAQDWQINISRAATGNIIATLNGKTPSCQTIAPTAFVSRQGSTFVVRSQTSSTCTQPELPVLPFTSVADLGVLSEGTYNVSWSLAVLDIPFGVPINTTFAINGNSGIAQAVWCDLNNSPGGPSNYFRLYFAPATPSSSDRVSLFGGRFAYMRPTATTRITGTTIDLQVEADYRGIAGPEECAVTTLGPLAAGTYTLNLYFKDRGSSGTSELALSKTLVVSPVDELSVVPSAPQPGESVAIQVPGLACYISQSAPRIDAVNVDVRAMTIGIEVEQFGWTCFSAGDPLVDKSYKVDVGILPPGSYCVNYTRRMSGAINMTRQLAFAVGVPFTPAATCQPRRVMLGYAVEYFHAAFEHYFVTNDPNEVEMLDAGAFQGWQRTGQRFNVFPTRISGTAPVIRYFSDAFAPKSTHFYTLRAINFAATLEPSWQYEGEPFYMMSPSVDGMCPAATVPIYRYYNKSKGGTPNHRFVADRSVHEAMLAAGWIAEGFGSGVAMCGPA